MVRDQDEFGGDDLSLRLLLDQFEQINASLGDAAGDAVAMNDAKRRGLGKCRSSLQSCASGRSR